MSHVAATCEPSRARLFGEIVGQIRGLPDDAADEQVRIRLAPLIGTPGLLLAAGRTGFFWKRRLRQGAYRVTCGIQINGKTNAVDAGRVYCHGGINTLDVDLSGTAVGGRVHVGARRALWATELRLASKGNDSAVHKALLDAYGQFMFAGVNRGTYILQGEVRGCGDLRRDILVPDGRPIDVGVLAITPRPYVRFALRTSAERPLRGPVAVTLEHAQKGRTWGWEGRLREIDEGTIVARNTFHGLYRYRVETRLYEAAGEVRLSCDDVSVPVVCRRRRVVLTRGGGSPLGGMRP